MEAVRFANERGRPISEATSDIDPGRFDSLRAHGRSDNNVND
jgi:hypothetical protein